MADTIPMPPTGGPNLVGELAQLTDQLRESREQAMHYATLLAVIAARVGPFQVTAREYEAAEPGRFGGWSTMGAFDPTDVDAPMAFGFWDEHLSIDGLATREPQITKVLLEHRSTEPPVQARAVLTALGLPVQPLEG